MLETDTYLHVSKLKLVSSKMRKSASKHFAKCEKKILVETRHFLGFFIAKKIDSCRSNSIQFFSLFYFFTCRTFFLYEKEISQLGTYLASTRKGLEKFISVIYFYDRIRTLFSLLFIHLKFLLRHLKLTVSFMVYSFLYLQVCSLDGRWSCFLLQSICSCFSMGSS